MLRGVGAAGGRGRPRVTYDVTAALNAIGICVFLADIYVEVSPVPRGTDLRHKSSECPLLLLQQRSDQRQQW